MKKKLIKNKKPTHVFKQGDCLDLMKKMPDNSVDLIFCSPPYENRRSYEELQFDLEGEEWVAWSLERFKECNRICKGLVAWVVAGKTEHYRWSATPALLQADLHRAGLNLRDPPVFARDGIPGSGGPDWLAKKYETIICTSRPGRLPWSDNTFCGHPTTDAGNTKIPVASFTENDGRPVGRYQSITGGYAQGDVHTRLRFYRPPIKANPGSIIKMSAGKGHMGSDLAHENEAPFPEALADFFITSFCKPGGTVLDIFSGSGTTVASACKNGRSGIGFDLRERMVELGEKRLKETKRKLGFSTMFQR